VALAVFVTVVAAVSALSLLGARLRPEAELPSLTGWAVANRSYGAPLLWCVLGGSLFTAYTTVAVPALVYGVGALGFFAIPYTVVFFTVAFLVLPRLWTTAARHGCLTPADLVRVRTGSPMLSLAVALTGLLATMPYVALQLLAIQTLLRVLRVPADGVQGDLAVAAVAGVLAVAVFRRGLRAANVAAVLKVLLLFPATMLVVLVVTGRLGGPALVFDLAGRELSEGGSGGLLLSPGLMSTYASLALGSALALLVYPHVLTPAFSARSPNVLRRVYVLLPIWSLLLLGLSALLGLGALATGVDVTAGAAGLAVPRLVLSVLPAALAGVVLAAWGVAALVPAAVMSVAVAATFTRNVYVEFVHPTATPSHQQSVARIVSVLVKAGAVVFVLALRTQDAINLQLLGGVWILQTLPAVVIATFFAWPHRWALLAGWAAGMTFGTVAVAGRGFAAVLQVSVGPWDAQVYVALLALMLNLAVVAVLTPLLDRVGASRGVDATRGVPPGEELWSRA
jgi:SSS family solute:Na+ symporter